MFMYEATDMAALVKDGMCLSVIWVLGIWGDVLKVGSCNLNIAHFSTSGSDLGYRPEVIVEGDADNSSIIINPNDGQVGVHEKLFHENLSLLSLILCAGMGFKRECNLLP